MKTGKSLDGMAWARKRHFGLQYEEHQDDEILRGYLKSDKCDSTWDEAQADLESVANNNKKKKNRQEWASDEGQGQELATATGTTMTTNNNKTITPSFNCDLCDTTFPKYKFLRRHYRMMHPRTLRTKNVMNQSVQKLFHLHTHRAKPAFHSSFRRRRQHRHHHEPRKRSSRLNGLGRRKSKPAKDSHGYSNKDQVLLKIYGCSACVGSKRIKSSRSSNNNNNNNNKMEPSLEIFSCGPGDDDDDDDETQREIKFTCELCFRFFAHRSLLTRHQLFMHSVNRCQCVYCRSRLRFRRDFYL